jgi:hypothetical protein
MPCAQQCNALSMREIKSRDHSGRELSRAFGWRTVLIEHTCSFLQWACRTIPSTLRWIHRRLGMAQRHSFAEMRAEQARMTESWKAEGRTTEAWAVADPEIVEIFSAGVAFGIKAGRRSRRDPGYTPDEWRRALREAMEKAAALEVKLERATGSAATKVKD